MSVPGAEKIVIADNCVSGKSNTRYARGDLVWLQQATLQNFLGGRGVMRFDAQQARVLTCITINGQRKLVVDIVDEEFKEYFDIIGRKKVINARTTWTDSITGESYTKTPKSLVVACAVVKKVDAAPVARAAAPAAAVVRAAPAAPVVRAADLVVLAAAAVVRVAAPAAPAAVATAGAASVGSKRKFEGTKDNPIELSDDEY